MSHLPDTSSAEVAAAPAPVVAFTIEELSVGGAERMVVRMANEFLVLGWQVHVVCLRSKGELAEELDPCVHIQVLNKLPGVELNLLSRLSRCITEINPLVVNSHLWVANTWTRLSLLTSRIPVVATEHSRDTWKPRYYRWIDRLLAFRTAAIVAVSGDTADFYRDTIGLNASLITVVNNGVYTQHYARGDGQVLRGQWLAGTIDQAVVQTGEKEQFLVGTVGRFVAAKNHRRLLGAMQLLHQDEALAGHDIRLVMVGDGEERGEIESYATELGLHDAVVFTGSRHDIPDVLAAFDLFVLSSDREGHPLTALEAQAAGTPVVLTDAGGSSEAIACDGDQVGGLLVERSTEALMQAIREMILQPEVREQRARFARQYALGHFDEKLMVKRYEKIFLSVGRQ